MAQQVNRKKNRVEKLISTLYFFLPDMIFGEIYGFYVDSAPITK